MEEKRTAIEMLWDPRRDEKAECNSEVANLSDGASVETGHMQSEQFYREGCVWSLVHDKEMLSARTRRQGKLLLNEQSVCPRRDRSKSWNECWR